MRSARLRRLLGLTGISLFIATAFTPLPNLLDRLGRVSPQLVLSDAIVVPGGGGILSDGTLSNSSAIRMRHGISLYRRNLAPLLIFLGPAWDDSGPTEAQARAALAQERGIPAGAILTDGRGRTTQEEVVRVKALLRTKGVRTILLVTDSLHIVRAQPLFERAGFRVHAAPTDEFAEPASTPEDRLALMRGILEQLAARLYYQVMVDL